MKQMLAVICSCLFVIVAVSPVFAESPKSLDTHFPDMVGGCL